MCAGLLAACVTGLSAIRADHLLSKGTWGGPGVELTVTDTGGHFEFDCASGDIDHPLSVDDKGAMAIDGVFIAERPGAVRLDATPDKRSVRFVGRLAQKTLSFDITVKDSPDKLGHFEVTLDAAARVRKCR